MNNHNTLKLNNIVSLAYQICAVLIGLVIPRLILEAFGSEVNGMLNSMKQMLSVITLLDFGVGAVVQAALYKPLLDRNSDKISNIFFSAKKYFNKIAFALLLYVSLLAFYYGIFKTSDDFSWIFTTTLLLSLAINYFSQYYFGICNTLLLNADQRVYVVNFVNLVSLVLNGILVIVLIYLKYSIQMVQLASSMLFLVRPLMLHIYVKKNFLLKKIDLPPKNSIPNKWSGLTQHVASCVTNSVDTVILTIMSSFQSLSVYFIYVMPLNCVRGLVETTSTSYKSFFGNIIAKENFNDLLEEFDKYEIMMHYLTSIIFGTIIVVLTPFCVLYSNVVSDVNYNEASFGVAITIAYAIYILRLPYTNIVAAAGKFKETQIYSIIEVAINIIVSVILVKSFGLLGVALGTAVSSGYRMLATVIFLKKNILFRSSFKFIRIFFLDIMSLLLIVTISHYALSFVADSFFKWILFSGLNLLISFGVTTILFLIFMKKSIQVRKMLNKIIKRKK